MFVQTPKKAAILVAVIGAFFLAGIIAPATRSANLTSVSITLSNPRLSFRGSLDSGNVVGSSQVSINTGSNHPSLTTAQLLEGDGVAIGEGGSLGLYTIAGTAPAADFTITTTLASGDTDLDDDVISTQSATHTVRFTTATAIANGRFRILVPALANDANSADGIPDGGAFDFGSSAPVVTCPDDVTGYDFVAGTATASAITIGSNDYHAYECAYSGPGGVGTVFDGVTNDAIVIDSIINPAPESGHSTGTADSYSLVVQQIDAGFSVADTTSAAVGVIEAVKVTATVDATISFSIAGVASGQTRCGVSTGVTTTAAAVPFGSLSLSSFGNAAQSLDVSTNAVNGYSVTAIENDQLGLAGATCVGDNTGTSCIQDATGNGGAMTHTSPAEWTNTSAKGFAYSLQNGDAASTAFQYTTATGNCSGTYCARQFADSEDTQTPVEIFSSTTVADSETVDVCYRIIPSVINAAGDYENSVTYTATATF